MSYLALARKWRPKAFNEVVGQSHVVQALSNALDSGRVHHAFLFTGTRGVGKTTLARIFAKSLNCDEGTSAEPCQQCNTCVSIDEGRYVDLIEVDAASRTKVDDTRELLENVQYAPTSGKYKVYLIDEVHMLSGHSFNALLKTLEEPPEHVKFLFATTDPQKLPVTVLSRCLQFNLRAMRPEQIENQLVKILGKEQLEFDQAALTAIAKAADGSMRDGLSLLDQAIAQGAGRVSSADVESMLGTIRTEHSEALINALIHNDADKIMQVIADMADHAVDFSAAIDELLMQLYHVSLAQISLASLAAKDLDSSLIENFAKAVSAETIQLYYQIGLLGKRDIALAPSLRVGFEMAMLRMLAFEPASSTEPDSAPASGSAAGQSNRMQATAADPSMPNTTGQQRTESADQKPAGVQAPAASHAESHSGGERVDRKTSNQGMQTPPQQPPASDAKATPVKAKTEPAEIHQPPANPANPASSKVAESSGPSRIAITLAGNNEWGELIEQTALIGLSKELAMHCACEKLTPEKVELTLSPKAQHLFKEGRVLDIQAEIRRITSTEAVVEITVEESDKETPAECLQRLGFEQLEQTRESLQNDPGVKALISEFGATIDEQSIKPV